MSYDQIQVNTQSSIRIEGSKILYFDPFQIHSDSHDADVIFITHAHQDHFDPESINHIRKQDTIFIVPTSMEKKMDKITDKGKLHFLKPGENIVIEMLNITSLPAYNKRKPFHPKRNAWLGYVVARDGIRYYVSGDTDAVKEIQTVNCDVAFVPIGGTFTMTAKEAAGLINQIKPSVAIPTHYGSIVGKAEDAEEFRKLIDPNILVEVKLL